MISHLKNGTQVKGFENNVLRRIFGCKRDKITRD
jgi:hypothetical protein